MLRGLLWLRPAASIPKLKKCRAKNVFLYCLLYSTENSEEPFLAHDLALTQRPMNHPKIYFDHEKLIAYRLEIKSKSMIKIKKGPGGRGRIAMGIATLGLPAQQLLGDRDDLFGLKSELLLEFLERR